MERFSKIIGDRPPIHSRHRDGFDKEREVFGRRFEGGKATACLTHLLEIEPFVEDGSDGLIERFGQPSDQQNAGVRRERTYVENEFDWEIGEGSCGHRET